MSEFDVNTGTFQGEKYPVQFEFYGHVCDERGISVLSKNAAYEIGFSAIPILESRGVKTEGKPEWQLEDPIALIKYMEALEYYNVRLQNRIVTLITATIQEQMLSVRLYLSQTLETLDQIDDHVSLVVLSNGRLSVKN